MNHDERSRTGPLTGAAGSTPQQTPGADVGGIARTADSAIRDSKLAPDQAPNVRPAQDAGGAAGTTGAAPGGGEESGGKGGERAGGTGGKGGPAMPPKAGGDDGRPGNDPPGQEDESAAESLGRAIGAPLSGEAAPREPRR